MLILESLGALEGLFVSPSAALAASGEAYARGMRRPRGAGGSWAGWGQGTGSEPPPVSARSSEPQGRSGGAGLGGKCQAKQTVLEVKELKGCWYHNPQSLHLFLLFPKHDREQPALGGQRDNRTLLMQCCVW